MAVQKLLANADRRADESSFSRDLIDLAMMRADRKLLEAACAKAEGAYGDSVRDSHGGATDHGAASCGAGHRPPLQVVVTKVSASSTQRLSMRRHLAA